MDDSDPAVRHAGHSDGGRADPSMSIRVRSDGTEAHHRSLAREPDQRAGSLPPQDFAFQFHQLIGGLDGPDDARDRALGVSKSSISADGIGILALQDVNQSQWDVAADGLVDSPQGCMDRSRRAVSEGSA